MFELGTIVPEFSLPSHDGSVVGLGDLLEDHSFVVIAFYVFDFSPT